MMGRKLFVGNLPFNATEANLHQIFSQYGNVGSVRIIFDQDSGRSKGYGFVEMGTDQEAVSAAEVLNGAEYEGRSITVATAKPQPGRMTGMLRRR